MDDSLERVSKRRNTEFGCGRAAFVVLIRCLSDDSDPVSVLCRLKDRRVDRQAAVDNCQT